MNYRKELFGCAPQKHPYHAFFKERKIPFYLVAEHISCSRSRLHHILNKYTLCPSDVQDRLDRLVRQIRIEEGSYED